MRKSLALVVLLGVSSAASAPPTPGAAASAFATPPDLAAAFGPVREAVVTRPPERPSRPAKPPIAPAPRPVRGAIGITVQVIPLDPAPRVFPTRLGQSYPNPFRGSTTIHYSLATSAHVSIAIFGLAGRRLATLVEGDRDPGSYDIRWDGRDDSGRALPAGIYFYREVAGPFVATRKLVIR